MQHNCSYMVASSRALIAADPTAAAAAGRAGRVESLDAIDADPAAAANAAALDAARGRHSFQDEAAAAAAATLRRLAHARTPHTIASPAPCSAGFARGVVGDPGSDLEGVRGGGDGGRDGDGTTADGQICVAARRAAAATAAAAAAAPVACSSRDSSDG